MIHLFVVVNSIFIARNFAAFFEIIIEATLICVEIDEEMFLGKQRFIESNLLHFIDLFSKEKNRNEFHIRAHEDENQANNEFENNIINPTNINDLLRGNEKENSED